MIDLHLLYDTELPIRDEILQSQAAAVEHWVSPGTWFSSAQRKAIVEETRRARDAADLPPWVGPSTVEGLIPSGHPLSAAIVDIIWRLVNHVGSLTHSWYTSVVPEQVSAGEYVEIVGLVAQASLVDLFADGLSLPRIELPPAKSGKASQEAPAEAAVSTHWVPTAPIVDGSWKPDVEAEVPNVRKALSLVPDERRMQWVLIDGHYVKGGALSSDFAHKLSRPQMELIGSRTSAVNECFY